MKPIKKLLLLGAIVLVSGVGLASAYVGLGVAADLRSARAALSAGASVDNRGLETARDRLRRANGRLESGPAQFLAVVPVARQNLRAVKSAVDALLPAVEAAGRLKAAFGDLGKPVVSNGRVHIEQSEGLRGPLQDQANTVAALERSLEGALSGWLVPRSGPRSMTSPEGPPRFKPRPRMRLRRSSWRGLCSATRSRAHTSCYC